MESNNVNNTSSVLNAKKMKRVENHKVILKEDIDAETDKIMEQSTIGDNIDNENTIIDNIKTQPTINDNIDNENTFVDTIKETLRLYIQDGARSNSNVNYFHNFIKNHLLNLIQNKPEYLVKLEYNLKSTNSSGLKRCDIVILKNNEPYIVFPVKIIKSNYKQNKNNSWENLTGELQHLMWANENLKIIPINIFMNKTPYLKSNKQISKFENVTFDDINVYNFLVLKNIAYDMINYIMLVNHEVHENDYFNKIPTILGFDSNTPYRKMSDILENLL
jgi:hypothetical protein